MPFAAQRGWLGTDLQDWIEQRGSAVEFQPHLRRAGRQLQDDPNDFLRSAMGTAPPGRALDVAMGEGRNAVHLASLGWKVTGFDVSEVGLEKARERAKQAGVTIEKSTRAPRTSTYGRDQWDLIVLEYAPVHYDDAGFHAASARLGTAGRLCAGRDPGRVAGCEGEASARAGRPRARRVEVALPGFEMVFYREAVGMSDWFPRETLIVRMLARKPNGPCRRWSCRGRVVSILAGIRH